MAQVTLKGQPVRTAGDLPAVGSAAPEFTLVRSDLSPLTSGDLAGRRVILSIFPSVDTPVCAAAERTFNQRAAGLDNVTVVCASMDLPFAQKRFCSAEGIENVETGSAFRSPEFGRDYGVVMTDGPLAGLLARAVVCFDEQGTVVHSQLVPEIVEEPDYEAAIGAFK